MDIPITISVKGNEAKAKLRKELFGLGEEITDPEVLKILNREGIKGPHYFSNSESIIADGIILTDSKKREHSQVRESFEDELEQLQYIISLLDDLIGISKNIYTISDWFYSKIKNHNCKIMIDGKEVQTKDEFQKTLDDYIKDNQT